MSNHQELLDRVNTYYTGKVIEHGSNHKGVDWNSTESQELRFDQLIKLFEHEDPFSILDYGSGYGAMAHYMRGKKLNFTYLGYDISDAMMKQASDLNPPETWDFTTDFDLVPQDYVVSSGIFNVKFGIVDNDWKAYFLDTVNRMWTLCTKGMGFNVLTSYSDPEYRRDDLYYADPLFFFDYAKKNWSRHVTLLHDYGLYEFTLLVRR